MLAALQELEPQIAFMSGHLGSSTEERLRDLGAATVILKPFRLTEVAQVVRELTCRADGILSRCKTLLGSD